MHTVGPASLHAPAAGPERCERLESDFLLSSGQGGGFEASTSQTGEHQLRWAILIDAIETFRGSPSSGVRGRRRTQWNRDCSWLFSDDTAWPFSFVSICDALGLDPGYVRCLALRDTGASPRRKARRAPGERWTAYRLMRLRARRQPRAAATSGDGSSHVAPPSLEATGADGH